MDRPIRKKPGLVKISLAIILWVLPWIISLFFDLADFAESHLAYPFLVFLSQAIGFILLILGFIEIAKKKKSPSVNNTQIPIKPKLGLGEIITSIPLFYFGGRLYIHGMPMDNIGLIFIIWAITFFVFGLVSKLKVVKSKHLIWLLFGLTLIVMGIWVTIKIRGAYGCYWGGGLDPWCNVNWISWPIITPAIGIFIVLISAISRKFKNV